MTAREAGADSAFGLVADVHSNLQALEAALGWLDGEGVEAVYCLGDVVGYGGDPAACVARVRERCAGTVRGNHDAAVVEPRLRTWFNPHARQAIERQAELLAEDEKAWLEALPATIDLGEVRLTHSGFADPAAFDYVTGAARAAIELEALGARWGFFAHTHVPAAFRRKPDGDVVPVGFGGGGELDLSPPADWFVNPGAVGQPRDRDPRAACATFDPVSGVLRHVRLEYDVAAAQEAIRAGGMPEFEATRLAVGM